ncbi:hypothetical protein H1R20_g6539, partial [Candolleomyces eurysporus]
MESTTLEFPQEIVNAVVGHYAIQTDSKALKTLGLVSRAWSHPTREHLFRAIMIDMKAFPSLQERLDALKSLLQAKPLLCQYIKSLTIEVGTFLQSLESLHPDADFDSLMWMDDPVDVLSLLASLTHVTHVAVGVRERSNYLRPRCIPYYFQAALQSLFARPHVTSISLSYIKIDLIPLTQYHHIEELALHGVGVPSWSQDCCFPMNRLPTTPRCLRGLSLSMVYPEVWRVLALCCASPEATLSLRKTKELAVSTGEFTAYSTEDFTSIDTLANEQWSTIFDTYGGAVESYTLRQYSYHKLSPTFASLRSFPNLNQLSLEILYERVSYHGEHGSMPVLVQALEECSQLDEPSNLTSIRVTYFGCAEYITLNDLKAQGEQNLWARLDGILEGHTFSSLKEVVFTIKFYCCTTSLGGEQCAALANMFHTQFFPSLSRRGILALRFHHVIRSDGDPFFEPPHIVKTYLGS